MPTHPKRPTPRAITSATSDPLPTATAAPTDAAAVALELAAESVSVGSVGWMSVTVVPAELNVCVVSAEADPLAPVADAEADPVSVSVPDADADAEPEPESPVAPEEKLWRGPPGVADVRATTDVATAVSAEVTVMVGRSESVSSGSETAARGAPQAAAAVLVRAARGRRRAVGSILVWFCLPCPVSIVDLLAVAAVGSLLVVILSSW